jgi:hypothetical protein
MLIIFCPFKSPETQINYKKTETSLENYIQALSNLKTKKEQEQTLQSKEAFISASDTLLTLDFMIASNKRCLEALQALEKHRFLPLYLDQETYEYLESAFAPINTSSIHSANQEIQHILMKKLEEEHSLYCVHVVTKSIASIILIALPLIFAIVLLCSPVSLTITAVALIASLCALTFTNLALAPLTDKYEALAAFPEQMNNGSHTYVSQAEGPDNIMIPPLSKEKTVLRNHFFDNSDESRDLRAEVSDAYQAETASL